ncbi:MAG: MBL fold metallo-hydrolase [Microscillaceae bacterium]|jgi:glyoxylase-like metal-dependent hydrolase (beta-lactamase superfamily II)|nr:MBL fold metallo-hydrolase [Microscillaceae bacterium]
MSLIKIHQYDDITYFELGYAWYGKPMVRVYCYYLKGILIDSGQSNLQKGVLELFSARPIQKIVLTHYHEDHSGNAEVLRQAHQAQVLASPLTIQKISTKIPLKLYQIYSFGRVKPVKEATPLPDLIENQDFRLLPIPSPGHSADHFAFLDQARGCLFAGDIYLGNIRMMRPEENIKQMIESLKRLLTYDFEVLFCAHNPKLSKGKSYLAAKLQHLEDFYGKVKVLQNQGLGVGQIIKSVSWKENYIGKVWTFNDIGLDFMIRSAMKN